MTRVVAISLVLLAGATMLAAQAIDQYQPRRFDSQAAQAHSVLTLDLPESRLQANPGCPASFSARQGGTGNLVAVKPGQKSEPESEPSQHIRLSVAGYKNSAGIVEALITVHGLTPKLQMMPVSPARGPANISRNLHVGFTKDDFGETGADLTLAGFTAVFSIDVDSVTYGDGSTWRSGPGVCRVIPNPVMLISAR